MSANNYAPVLKFYELLNLWKMNEEVSSLRNAGCGIQKFKLVLSIPGFNIGIESSSPGTENPDFRQTFIEIPQLFEHGPLHFLH